MTQPMTEREHEVWRAFLVMRKQLDLSLERRLQSDAGISTADYEVLMALFNASDKRLRAGRIAELIGWEKSRVSHQITRMEARGLVGRQECGDDARGTWIVLTSDGSRAVLGAIRHRTAAVREYFFDALTDEQLEAISTISTQVLATLDPLDCRDEKSA
jgi:DNA-binding MarR family transcriptional regulator